MFQLRKKTIAVTTAAFVIAGGGAAYAYWTTTGTGDGSALNASKNGTIALHASWDTSKLAPGVTLPVTFTGDNAGETDLYVGTITSAVSTSDPACLPGDFTVAPFTANTVVAGGKSGVALGQGEITFKNSAQPQDACKTATITLTLSSN